MTRKEFLVDRMFYVFDEVLKRASQIPVNDRAITCPAMDLEEPATSDNGKDSNPQINFRKYAPGIFIVEENWPDDGVISHYHIIGCIALSKQDVKELISLPLDK